MQISIRKIFYENTKSKCEMPNRRKSLSGKWWKMKMKTIENSTKN